jgi:hypothetical protein
MLQRPSAGDRWSGRWYAPTQSMGAIRYERGQALREAAKHCPYIEDPGYPPATSLSAHSVIYRLEGIISFLPASQSDLDLGVLHETSAQPLQSPQIPALSW